MSTPVHVCQQTGAAISMLPQEGSGIEIDPDPRLEREAEDAAQQAMADGPVTINRMGAEMHIQRSPQGTSAVTAGNSQRISDLAESVSQLTEQLDDVNATLDHQGSMLEEHETQVGKLWSKYGELASGTSTDSEGGFSTGEKIVMGVGSGALLGGFGDLLKGGMGQMAGNTTGDPMVDLAVTSVIGATAGGTTALAGMGLSGAKELFAEWRDSDTFDEWGRRGASETAVGNSQRNELE